MADLPDIVVPPTSLRITCGDIELRLPTPRYASAQLAATRDEEMMRFLNWTPQLEIDDALSYISDALKLWQRGVSFLPSIFLHDEDLLIGATGISSIDRINRRGEVGTWISIPHQGHGHNLRAKAAVCALGFGLLDLNRLEFVVRVDNARSIASMKHLNCIFDEGTQHARIVDRAGVAHDAQMFAITRASYDPASFPPVSITR